MKRLIFVFLCFSTLLHAQKRDEFFNSAHEFFSTYVKKGAVDYAAVKKNPQQLNQALQLASKIRVSAENTDVYQAFWINAYNLAVIKGVVKNYPITSPMKVKGFFDAKAYTFSGKKVSLNDIEHDLLFGKFPEEARFHFVLVCAAKSCPPLLAEAYRPKTLQKQLQAQTKKAMNSQTFTKVKNGKVAFSEIMKWYRKDFTKQGQSLIQFANNYRKEPIPTDFKIEFYNYNWQLNDY